MGIDSTTIEDLINNTRRNVDGSIFEFSTDPIQKMRVGTIGLGKRGNALLEILQYLAGNEMDEVISLSDISSEEANKSAEKTAVWQSKKPTSYYKAVTKWKKEKY